MWKTHARKTLSRDVIQQSHGTSQPLASFPQAQARLPPQVFLKLARTSVVRLPFSYLWLQLFRLSLEKNLEYFWKILPKEFNHFLQGGWRERLFLLYYKNCEETLFKWHWQCHILEFGRMSAVICRKCLLPPWWRSSQIQLKRNKLHFMLGAQDLLVGCGCGWDAYRSKIRE